MFQTLLLLTLGLSHFDSTICANLPDLAHTVGKQDEIDRLIKQLDHDDLGAREEATLKLIGLWEHADVKKRLQEELKKVKQSNAEVADRCSRILERIAFHEALGKDLVIALGTEKVDDLYYFYREHPKKVNEAVLVKCFERWMENAEIRKRFKLQDERAQADFAKWLTGRLKNPDARFDFLLVMSRHPSCKGIVAVLLKDKEARMRAWAALTLAEFGAKEYAEEIAQLLKDSGEYTSKITFYVRGKAARALALLGMKEYSKDIAQLLNHECFLDAVEVLSELGATEYSKEIAKLMDHKSHWVQSIAIDALGRLGAKEYQDKFLGFMRNKSEEAGIIISAIKALGNFGAKECSKEISSLLQDKRWQAKLSGPNYGPDGPTDVETIGSAAVQALGQLGAKEYIKDLVKLLDSKNTYVQRSAIYALGQMGAKEHIKDIARFLKDKDSCCRAFAVIALGKLKATEYSKKLKELQSDSDEYCDATRYELITGTVGKASTRVLKDWGMLHERKE